MIAQALEGAPPIGVIANREPARKQVDHACEVGFLERRRQLTRGGTDIPAPGSIMVPKYSRCT